MFNVEKRIKELEEENKSLKVKAIMLGIFSLTQFGVLFSENIQKNILTFGGVILIALGIGTISIVSSIMIKTNNKLIDKYKQL
jgi:hypothetical protein